MVACVHQRPLFSVVVFFFNLRENILLNMINSQTEATVAKRSPW